MEAQNDMIVVIVGDEEDIIWEKDKEICAPNKIKEEPLEEYEINDIMDTVQRYGQPIKIEMESDEDEYGEEFQDLTFERAVQSIKKEVFGNSGVQEEEYVFLDDNYSEGYKPYEIDGEYVPLANDGDNSEPDDNDGDVYMPDENDEDSDEYRPDSDSEVEHKRGKHRTTMVKPSLRKSFINDLRHQYPELTKNEKALIKTVAEIMRNIKPPKPPKDYFLMNGINYECRFCGAISKCIPAADRHYQEKHGPRYLVCFACGVDFRSKTNLYKHEKRCTAQDSVIMLKARALFLGRKGRSRPYIPDLSTIPVMKPVNTKRFVCSQCSATFVTKVNLVAHENCHRGVRPFCCDKCPNAYSSLSALTRHAQNHSDQQYICDHCQRAFKVKAALVAHMNTHEPVPKWGCSECPKRFATKNAMNHHLRTQHLNLPMPCACQICPRRYPRMSLLRDHMKKKHGMALMTRKMFFKMLPTMTEEQLMQAKEILKEEGPMLNLSADIDFRQEGAKWIEEIQA